MSTVYSKTVTVPVYASWKCEKCNTVNFSEGEFVGKFQESTASLLPSKHKKTREKVSNRAHSELIPNMYQIICDPNHSNYAMYNNLIWENARCKKCKKSPRWNKGNKIILPLAALCAPVVFFSGLMAFTELDNVVAWLVFAVSLGYCIWGGMRESMYKKILLKLPKEYTPVIGSQNEELIAYAAYMGRRVPTPDECTTIVKEYCNDAQEECHADKSAISGESNANNIDTEKDISSNQAAAVHSDEPLDDHANFCRKCGTKLKSDSVFCHNCGTRL